jgi:hypothetical protein
MKRMTLRAAVGFLILINLGSSHGSGRLSGQEDWRSAMRQINPNLGEPFEINEQRVEAAGIQKISGLHLDLYTDVRDPKKVVELVEVFNQSIVPWCDYFDVDVAKTKNWKMRAFLIADAEKPDKFRQAGLMPDDLPDFRAGFQRRHDLWLYLQPGNYYTRHLLIHEGTHGFMEWFAGGYGAPWYSEGIAELFGVHRWNRRELELRYRLRDRREADYWGRVKRIKVDRADGKAMSLTDVLTIAPTAFLEVRYYAWSWAGCEFFGKHETSKAAFAKLRKMANVHPTIFNQQFIREIQPNWSQLERDWELFLAEMEYGYEIQRGRLTDAEPVSTSSGVSKSKFRIQSDRSWQKTSVAVKKGDRLQIVGKGEFQVGASQTTAANEPQPWLCQSNGITIEYYNGHPLGMLHAGVFADGASDPKEQIGGLIESFPVGSGSEFLASRDGILCLRINESPAKLDDNSGALEVTIEKLE